MAIDGDRILPCPGVETFLDSREDLYLLPIAGRDQLRIEAPLGRWVWSALTGASLQEMPLEVAQQVAEALDWLESETYVRRERALSSDDTQHWDRQVRWLAQQTGDGPARQRRLGEARVMMLGVGGLGCSAADLLARAGVGTLVLVDHDSVDVANLARQQLYDRDDVGRPKVAAAAERLLAVAPQLHVATCATRITSAHDLEQLLDEHEVDLVVCAADTPTVAIKHWAEDAAATRGVAVVYGGHRAPLAYAGPFFIPGITACYECFATAQARPGAEQLEAELSAYRDAHPPPLPAVCWGDALAASMIVAQAVQWLAGVADSSLYGRELEVDMVTLESRWIEGPTAPQCRRCDSRMRSSA